MGLGDKFRLQKPQEKENKKRRKCCQVVTALLKTPVLSGGKASVARDRNQDECVMIAFDQPVVCTVLTLPISSLPIKYPRRVTAEVFSF